MANTSTYTNLAIALVGLSIIVLIAYLQGSINPKSIRITPRTALVDGFLASPSSSVSIIICASVDEVFGAILNFKDYSWSTTIEYVCPDNASKGALTVGSTGTVKINVEDFGSKILTLKITHLDHKNNTMIERTTQYPRWLLATERVLQVLPVKGRKGLCEFRSQLTFEGIAAYFLLFTAKEELVDTQRRFAEELKTFVQRRKP